MSPDVGTRIWKRLRNMPSKYPTNALIPYLTYGDPTAEFTEALIDTCFENGADAIEIGVPFSDPIADGPVIQASHQRALIANPKITLPEVLALVSRVKRKHKKPVILMAAANLIFHFGIQAFFIFAKEASLDGIVIPDLTVEEATPYSQAGKAAGVDVCLLISPQCSVARMPHIVDNTQGFLYLMAAAGTTGTRETMDENLAAFMQAIQKRRDIPVYVGFGISRPEHVQSVLGYADGAIVGSHLVKVIEAHLGDLDAAQNALGMAIRKLKGH